MSPNICRVVLAVLALPLLIEATIGCSYDPPGICPDTNPECTSAADENMYVCSCSCGPGVRTRTLRVAASEDDAEQPGTNPDIISNDLDMSAARIVGVRFRDTGIPVGADILTATVQFASVDDANPGAVTLAIAGEASANGAPFTTTANDLSSRALTVNSVSWDPPDWATGDLGADQLTPDLEPVIQEIVDQAGWAPSNAIVLLISGTVGTGVRHADSFDGQPDRAPLLVVTYNESPNPVVGPQDLPVCVPPAFNPNLDGGVAPTEDDLAADCSGRVADTLSGLAAACNYPSSCACTALEVSQDFSATCDEACTPDEVDADCADFDPVAGNFGATNAAGDEAVCLANSPMSSGIFGRRTACLVNGVAEIVIEGETKNPGVAGVVNFIGATCPGESCDVGMEYRLGIGNITFSNFFGSATFADIAGVGESLSGEEATLSSTGDGTFGQESNAVSGRGRRDSEALAIVTTNNDVVDVNVGWGSVTPTCRLDGALLGSVDPELKRCESAGPNADEICESDDDCADDPGCSDEICNCEAVGNVGMVLAFNDLMGDIVNQPPTANAGDDQQVECTKAGATNVFLDATASSDLDSDLTLFSWFRGSRTGQEVGIDAISKVEQPLGAQSYVLRTIDAFAQADEDTTTVDVTDTTPPTVTCSTTIATLVKTNHVMLNVGLAGSAEDVCEGTLTPGVEVFGDEDDQDPTGDGNHSPDAKNIDLGTLRLRQERRNAADGRVYLIIVDASDTSGNRGFDCCAVAVPHSTSPASLQSVAAQASAARTFCLDNGGTAPAGYFVIGDGPVIGSKQ